MGRRVRVAWWVRVVRGVYWLLHGPRYFAAVAYAKGLSGLHWLLTGQWLADEDEGGEE